MREIKFRAWDGKKMITQRYRTAPEVLRESEEGKWQVMQYTGLRDKNGKEIYEGDICKFVQEDGDESTSPILFKESQFTSDWSTQSLGILAQIYKGIEVVGNIFENPELINKEK